MIKKTNYKLKIALHSLKTKNSKCTKIGGFPFQNAKEFPNHLIKKNFVFKQILVCSLCVFYILVDCIYFAALIDHKIH